MPRIARNGRDFAGVSAIEHDRESAPANGRAVDDEGKARRGKRAHAHAVFAWPRFVGPSSECVVTGRASSP
jgi:hypothetical protein